MNISSVFTQVLILFILILVGYFARKKELLDDNSTSKLSTLIMSIFLPSMIINSMQIKYESNMISKIIMLIIISLFMYTISFIIAYLLRFFFKPNNDLGVYQFVIIFSNVGFMGYPIVQAVFGNEAVFYTAIFNLPFNLLIMTLGIFVLCRSNENYTFSINFLINPVLISVLIGLILFIFNIRLPKFINKPIELLGDITTPLSMLVIGSMLYSSSAIECFYNKKLYIVSFIRLIIIPLLIYILLKGIVKDSILLGIPVIISAMPAASNTAILANEYNTNEKLASQAVFISTLFSIVTIPLISGILMI